MVYYITVQEEEERKRERNTYYFILSKNEKNLCELFVFVFNGYRVFEKEVNTGVGEKTNRRTCKRTSDVSDP